MRSLINVKTAEKGLRFGPSKCKSMLIGKESAAINSDLQVDYWKVDHELNLVTGVADLKETFEGPMKIEKVKEQKYLGFIISASGDNMANISAIKKKSIGTIRSIFSRLDSLKLKKYYFECAKIFMNVMLRGSILYACETYYDLKESELRQIERIEETYMRKVFNTTRGCPIIQLYLEFSQIPARFEIMKIRLLFLQTILTEKEDSMILKFINLQKEQPVKGDWLSTCLSDLKSLGICNTLSEIKIMSKYKFNNILKEHIEKIAFEYLMNKTGSKGREILYEGFEMPSYLQPNENGLSIDDQRYIYALRNKMVDIPANYGSASDCVCGGNEDILHIFNCKYLNKENEAKMKYESIYTNNISEQIKVLRRFQENMEVRNNYIRKSENEKEMKNEHSPHVIVDSDPLFVQ